MITLTFFLSTGEKTYFLDSGVLSLDAIDVVELGTFFRLSSLLFVKIYELELGTQVRLGALPLEAIEEVVLGIFFAL